MAGHTLENELYSYHLKVTRVAEYGVSFAKLTAGEVAPPACGARFDVWFEGKVSGKVEGTIKGCDYIYVRADGRMELNVYGEINTNDGATIAVEATGTGSPVEGKPRVAIRENVKLFSGHEQYSWLNGLQIWGPGEVNLGEGTVDVTFYGH
jgi:hypothetical protein